MLAVVLLWMNVYLLLFARLSTTRYEQSSWSPELPAQSHRYTKVRHVQWDTRGLRLSSLRSHIYHWWWWWRTLHASWACPRTISICAHQQPLADRPVRCTETWADQIQHSNLSNQTRLLEASKCFSKLTTFMFEKVTPRPKLFTTIGSENFIVNTGLAEKRADHFQITRLRRSLARNKTGPSSSRVSDS